MARKEDEAWWWAQHEREQESSLTPEQYIESLHKRIEELEETVERYRGF